MRTVVGKRGTPLYYVVRDLLAVSDTSPPLIDGEPYFEEHGRLEDKLIFRASHVHSLFKQDAADVFQRLDRAVRENQAFAATIVIHAREKYGRGATFALRSQPRWKRCMGDYYSRIRRFYEVP